MTVWIIEPHDPLIFRDGRPFGPTPGARATSLSFPFPSTTAGGVRTQAGLDADGVFKYPYDQRASEHIRKQQEKNLAHLKLLKQLKVRGPLLVQLAVENNDIAPDEWLMPAPLDALLLKPEPEDSSKVKLRQLVPLARPSD